MNLEEKRLFDDLLIAGERSIGAAFCSYTFDPSYFEEQILRSVLHLTSDPEEDPVRFHQDARAALQETPVVCFVDAAVRKEGRRLPYDVHLIRKATFHPKLYLVLYASEARLAVGSGNMTKSGVEQNTELFFCRRLQYGAPADAQLLRSVTSFLEQCAALCPPGGAQFELLRETLLARLPPQPPGSAQLDAVLISSFGEPLLTQLGKLLPANARITRAGILAPFFEHDDLAPAENEPGVDAMLESLLMLRDSEGAVVDIAVPWDDVILESPGRVATDLAQAVGNLCAWRQRWERDGQPYDQMAYFVPQSVAARRVLATNAAGTSCRFDRDELETYANEGRLWTVPQPVVHAPRAILQRIQTRHDLRLWLHPSSELDDSGKPRRRPLHAKALLITVSEGAGSTTYALIGSANASKAALSRSVEQGGNVEVGVLCQLAGEVSVHDLLPTLVSYGLDGVSLEEREPIQRDLDLSAWIEQVIHDPADRTLQVTWSQSGPVPLQGWELHYCDRKLRTGLGVPHEPLVISQFDLDAGSAEVTFIAGEGRWQVPIVVNDLATLPCSPSLGALGLRELLALLGRRVSRERMDVLRGQRGEVGTSEVLDAIFGEGFGPNDVFKAWWGAMEDLSNASTVAAFRNRLSGALGVRAAWESLSKAVGNGLTCDEVWVYGCELLRELSGLILTDGPDTASKRALLEQEISALRAEVTRFTPIHSSHPWLGAVEQFYGLERANG